MDPQYTLTAPTGEMKITQDFTVQPHYWARIKVEYQSQEVDGALRYIGIDSSHLFQNVESIFRSIFSTVEINYNPGETKNITSIEIDEKIEASIRSGGDLAAEIQQLLIDIQSNDANDLQIWVDAHDGEIPPMDVKNKRMKRLKMHFQQSLMI